jgi:multimeric flavodoxin WrbA
MKILVLNGSPRKKGTIAKLLKAVAEGAKEKGE